MTNSYVLINHKPISVVCIIDDQGWKQRIIIGGINAQRYQPNKGHFYGN